MKNIILDIGDIESYIEGVALASLRSKWNIFHLNTQSNRLVILRPALFFRLLFPKLWQN